MPGDDKMEFKIGKYRMELSEGSLRFENTQTGEIYSCGLLNGYKSALGFLKGNPSEDQLCAAFDLR